MILNIRIGLEVFWGVKNEASLSREYLGGILAGGSFVLRSGGGGKEEYYHLSLGLLMGLPRPLPHEWLSSTCVVSTILADLTGKFKLL